MEVCSDNGAAEGRRRRRRKKTGERVKWKGWKRKRGGEEAAGKVVRASWPSAMQLGQ